MVMVKKNFMQVLSKYIQTIFLYKYIYIHMHTHIYIHTHIQLTKIQITKGNWWTENLSCDRHWVKTFIYLRKVWTGTLGFCWFNSTWRYWTQPLLTDCFTTGKMGCWLCCITSEQDKNVKLIIPMSRKSNLPGRESNPAILLLQAHADSFKSGAYSQSLNHLPNSFLHTSSLYMSTDTRKIYKVEENQNLPSVSFCLSLINRRKLNRKTRCYSTLYTNN